jgi:hypothetical protein
LGLLLFFFLLVLLVLLHLYFRQLFVAGVDEPLGVLP